MVVNMPWSALPEWIDSPEEWKGTDNDTPLMRWQLKIKGCFAYGPRAKEQWAKWREWPITLVAFFGKGIARFETEGWERDSSVQIPWHRGTLWFYDPKKMQLDRPKYVSVVQYWTRWHLAFHWPFHIVFHWYPCAHCVPKYPNKPDKEAKIFFFRIGARRDADKVYHFPSANIGDRWN